MKTPYYIEYCIIFTNLIYLIHSTNHCSNNLLIPIALHTTQYICIVFLGIEAEILQPLVEYFYTGKITVTNDNVIGLLEATSLLLLPKVVEACGQFLANHIDEANSLKIWAIATSRNYCGLQWLAGEALRFMQLHFESIWKEPEFILEAKNGGLNYEQLTRLLEADDLCVDTEENVYYCVSRWLNRSVTYLILITSLKHLGTSYNLLFNDPM